MREGQTKLNFSSVCGGKPLPIGELNSQFSGLSDVYGVLGSAYLGDIAIVIVVKSFTLPEGALGNSETIFVEAGTYLCINSSSLPIYTEVFQLQEKLPESQTLIDLDVLFGNNISNGGKNLTDTLNQEVLNTGNGTITLTESDFIENTISSEKLYAILSTAFNSRTPLYVQAQATIEDAITVTANYPLTLLNMQDTGIIGIA